MNERIFLEENGTTVTSARYVVSSNQTYAMSGVTSVKCWTKPVNKIPGVLLILIGLIVFFVAENAAGRIAGGASVIAGIVYLVLSKATHFVMIHSASGEAKATQSKDRAFINRVISALNDSIVARG
jgi:hypothetical protein